jgi:hypothetical protein
MNNSMYGKIKPNWRCLVKLQEGRYLLPGEPGTGILGKIEAQFVRVIAGSRRLSTPEMFLVRAVVCGILEELGGRLEKGRYEVELPTGESAPVSAQINASFEALHARIGDLEKLLHEAQTRHLDHEARVEVLEKAPAPPAVSAPDPRVEVLEKQVAELIKAVNGLRGTAPAPASKKQPAPSSEKKPDPAEKW